MLLCIRSHGALLNTAHMLLWQTDWVTMATAIVRPKLVTSAFNCAARDLAVASEARTTLTVLCESSTAWPEPQSNVYHLKGATDLYDQHLSGTKHNDACLVQAGAD